MSVISSIATVARSAGFLLGHSADDRGASRNRLASAPSVNGKIAEPSRAEPSRAEPSLHGRTFSYELRPV